MMTKQTSVRLITVLAVAVVMAVLLAVWLYVRQMALPPTTVYEALGVRVTLDSVKRISPDKVEVSLTTRNNRKDQQTVSLVPGDLVLRTPDRKWASPVGSVGYGGPSGSDRLKVTFLVPRRAKRVTIAYDFALDRPEFHVEFRFPGATATALPLSQKQQGVEITLAGISANPKIDRTKWGSESISGDWSPGRGKCFTVLVRAKFPAGFYGETHLSGLKDDRGKGYSYTAEYGNNSTSFRQMDASMEGLGRYLLRSPMETIVGTVSSRTADRIAEWQAERTRKAELAEPMPPEDRLYVFPYSETPRKFICLVKVDRDPPPSDTAAVVFQDVPVQ